MEITLSELNQLLHYKQQELPYPVGTAVYVRGCVYSAVGRIEGIHGQWLKLSEASHIGTDGRFHDATVKGIQNVDSSEIEPVGGDRTLQISLLAISDVCLIPEPLPSSQK